MVKYIQRIHWLLLTNCLSVFDLFVGLALKWLNTPLEPNMFKTNYKDKKMRLLVEL